MTDIQRWAAMGVVRDGDGTYVTYADHLEALRQAEQRGRESLMRDLWGER
jgi:hypothetical protein